MGLDIVALKKVAKVEVELDEDGDPIDDEWWDKVVRVYADGNRGQHDHLENKAFYSYEDRFSFRAGSYSGYSMWRDTLAKLAGYPETEYTSYSGDRKSHAAAAWGGGMEGSPFVELIDHSDCEGTIGPVTAAKLAKDFAEFEERARNFDGGEHHEWFVAQYLLWKEAFEFAADDGMLIFC